MFKDHSDEPTATEEREAAEKSAPPQPTSVLAHGDNRIDPKTGLPEGVNDGPSPLDPGMQLDPFRGAGATETRPPQP